MFLINKPKLTLQQQIEYMKTEKGIQFNIVTEEQALQFLQKSNYCFKLKAFAKNYQKYTNPKIPEKFGKYINLEFAYLQELSTLDALFRKKVMKMVLDVEHFLKVQLINHISENEKEDGYSIVEEFLKTTSRDVLGDIEQKSKNSYCADLVKKHKGNFSIWTFIEVISFGDFIELYNFYYSKYDNELKIGNLLYPIKCLRNAAAHNNCLIHRLAPPYTKVITPNKRLVQITSSIPDLPKRTYQSKMMNPTIHDFVALLEVYCKIVSPATIPFGINDLKDFFHVRCIKRKRYFEKNEILKSNYEFLVKVVDFYSKIG